MTRPRALLILCASTACTSPGSVALTPGESASVETALPDTSPGETATPQEDELPVEQVGSSLIRLDPAPGLLYAATQLTLRTDAEGEIHYTLDGSDPRSSPNALLYTAPLPLEERMILRAVLVMNGEATGPVSTGTWIFPEQVGDQQAPEGWPAVWFEDYGEGPYEALYTMEEDVVSEDPAALVAALEALPTLALVVDPEDLWGARGIYDHAWEEGAEWERPVHLALMNATEAWEADAGLRAYGGASRAPSGTPKKTFRVVFRSDYGPGELDEVVYGEEEDAINSVILRAGYNHTWTHWDPEQRSRSQYLRDRLARETQIAMGWAASRGRAVHLYLNGVYWGVYDIAERADAHFFAQAYGATDGSEDPADWDALNSGEAIDGDTSAWEATLALARAADGSDESLAALEAQIDVDALIDYMLLNFWAGNVDWPYHNWYAGRLREGGRWRFVSWDAEHILEDLEDDVTGVSDANTPAALWSALLRHPAFVERVVARADALLGEGGLLSEEQTVARLTALGEELRPGLMAESARWGSYRRDVVCYASPPCPLYTLNDWDAEHARLSDTLVPARTETVRDQLAARGWATSR